MRRRALFVIPFFTAFALLGTLFVASPRAYAALEGENGPIVYIDNQAQTQTDPTIVLPDELPPVEPENQVITTNSDGTGDIVADSTTDEITSATISAPTDEGNYSIVYATESVVDPCDGLKSDTLVPELKKPCNTGTEAVLTQVTLDENRNPISTPVDKTLDPLTDKNGKDLSNNWVIQTSYSPDGASVLITRVAQNHHNGPLYSAIELVSMADFANAPVVTVVASGEDECLSGGFAQDGSIYFSSCPRHQHARMQSDAGVYFYAVGADFTEAPQTLFENKGIRPYFIDVSPDSSQVLVADISKKKPANNKSMSMGTSCRYAQRVVNNDYDRSAGVCDYYYGSADSVTLISELSWEFLGVDFVPRFFSPDGAYIIGTVFPVDDCNQYARCLRQLNMEAAPYTAAFSRTEFTLTKLTDLIGVQEWAPLFVAKTEGNVLGTSTTQVQATLPNTGANSYAILLAALIALVVGLGLVVTPARNKS